MEIPTPVTSPAVIRRRTVRSISSVEIELPSRRPIRVGCPLATPAQASANSITIPRLERVDICKCYAPADPRVPPIGSARYTRCQSPRQFRMDFLIASGAVPFSAACLASSGNSASEAKRTAAIWPGVRLGSSNLPLNTNDRKFSSARIARSLRLQSEYARESGRREHATRQHQNQRRTV